MFFMILHFKISGLEFQSCSCFHLLRPHFLSNLYVSSSAVLVRQQMRKAPLASASCEECRSELPCLQSPLPWPSGSVLCCLQFYPEMDVNCVCKFAHFLNLLGNEAWKERELQSKLHPPSMPALNKIRCLVNAASQSMMCASITLHDKSMNLKSGCTHMCWMNVSFKS